LRSRQAKSCRSGVALGGSYPAAGGLLGPWALFLSGVAALRGWLM
jgi:hypothetical protein